ncbi:hypothetical protein [Pedobacter yulinensis]|nr:hypothetical protein [Pedobacter yulinensis]
MRPVHKILPLAVVVTLFMASCSTSKLASNTTSDDVYNSNAQARVVERKAVPQAARGTQSYYDDEYYGTSDPYYDMDYSSRINRFYYGSPWRTYYDPYYGYYGSGLSLGFGLGGPFYGNYWNSPYGGWGWNNWGWNSAWSPYWGWNNYWSPYWGYGNYWGGGIGWGGGGYWGGTGGWYTGRTTNVPDYRPRPARGSDYARPSRGEGNAYNGLSPRSRTAVTDANGDRVSGRSRSEMYRPDRSSGNGSNPSTRSNGNTEYNRPSRGNSENSRPTYTPPARTESRPTYTPPPSNSGGGSSGSSGGGGGRPTRGRG